MESYSRMRSWALPGLLLALCWASAAAQTLPAPAEFYFDEDAAVARPMRRAPRC